MKTAHERLIIATHHLEQAVNVQERARANESAGILRRQKADRAVEERMLEKERAEDAVENEAKVNQTGSL